MFNPFLNIAKLSAQYVLSYWTSQVNYTMFIKLILYFDQEWKHKSHWDQVLLLSQLLFLTLHRWGQENQTKTKTLTAKIFRLHREERKLNADELLKFLESYIWFCSGFSVVIIEIMLTLNRLLTFPVAVCDLLQWMDVCYCCGAWDLIPSMWSTVMLRIFR